MHPIAESATNYRRPDGCGDDAWWAVLEESVEPIALVDAGQARVVRCNSAFRQVRMRPVSLAGHSLPAAIARQLAPTRAGGGCHTFELSTDSGARIAVTAAPASASSHHWLVLLSGCADGDASTPDTVDAVTGIADRRSLELNLTRRFALKRPFAVVFIDLDGFKQINDTRGHLAGDDALREIAARLGGCLRDSDMIGRFGGDEFVALIDGAVREDDLRPIMRRVAEAVAQPLQSIGGEAAVTASVGWALSSNGHKGPREILEAADSRMYASKRAGGGPLT